MKVKEYIKKGVVIISIIIGAAILTPANAIRSIADGTNTATGFHAIVYGEDSTAAKTVSDDTYTITSQGKIVVDQNNANVIVMDATDFNRLAYYVNTTNSKFKSSYDTLIENKNKTVTIFNGIGYGSVSDIATSGIEKAADMVTKSANIKASIGY